VLSFIEFEVLSLLKEDAILDGPDPKTQVRETVTVCAADGQRNDSRTHEIHLSYARFSGSDVREPYHLCHSVSNDNHAKSET
jgi:hypothetical protein